ncbi:MAG TPA: ATP-binding protein [Candidatus Brocadiaceae bacterium]|nr:ATP-binding protein [Candidatus Brocadiaceae bacterium]
MKNQILGILGKKLLLYILALSLIPALILSYIYYVHSKRLLEIELFNELSLIGDALAEHIDAFLHNGENSAKHFSSDGFIRDRMESMVTTSENITISKELSKYLEYKTKLEPRFRETFTINQKGIVVASSYLPQVGVNLSEDLHTLETKGDSFVKDAYFCDLTGEYSLIFYSSVKHKDTEVFLGMIGIRMLASELDRITIGDKQASAVTSSSVPSSVEPGEKKEYLFSRGMTYFKPQSVETPQAAHGKGFKMRYSTELTTFLTRRGETSEAYLVNKNKLMLTSSRFIDNVLLRQEVDTLPVNTAIKEGKEIFGIYRDYRNVPVIGASKYIKSMNWILLVETDVWEAFQPVYRARNHSLAIIAACIFIISALAFLISHRIINPIKSLITATAKISKGDLDYHIQPTSRDEIGKLTEDFNRMTTNLATARNELRELFDAANDPMVTLKDGNMINNMNARVSELFGYTTEDLLLKKITSVIRNEDVPIVEEAINKAWRLKPGEKHPMLEVGVMKNDGNMLICELDLNRTRFGIQPHLRDITKRKLLEQRVSEEKQKLEESNTRLQNLLEELKRTQLQLFQSEKMASIGQLAAGIAHEINNPVGYISSNLDLMQNQFAAVKTLRTEIERLKTDPAFTKLRQTIASVNLDKVITNIEESIKESLEGTERIKKIISALSTFSYKGDDKLELANINTEIENTLNILWNEIKYKSELIKSYGDIPLMRCNRHQLGQVFMNIILNAVQAIKEKGEIRITTYQQENYIYIEMCDNGIGIPEQNLSKIFEPFFTTKEIGKGTGLGLSIAYNIIKSHNGTIEVKSKVNHGTTFTIILPVTIEFKTNLPF